MTSQLATNSPMSALNAQAQPAPSDEAVAVDQQRSRLMKAMKSQYQLDQQVKFLHLQAEADSLLQQLQVVKQQRQASASELSSQS